MAKDQQNDPETTVLFKEIDEELRQDKATLLWKQYGPTFITAIVVLIVAVASYEAWKYFDFSNRSALGEQFQTGLEAVQNEQLDQANSIFDTLSEEGTGYAVLADFQKAALLSQQGNYAEAASTYFVLSENADLESAFQNIALLLGAKNALNNGNTDEVVSKLETIASGASSWRHSALELQAYAHAQKGNIAKAGEILNNLINDATAPVGVRQRASEYAQVYGGPTQ